MTHSLVLLTIVLCTFATLGERFVRVGLLLTNLIENESFPAESLDLQTNDVYDYLKNSRMRSAKRVPVGERVSLVQTDMARRVSAGFSFHRYR